LIHTKSILLPTSIRQQAAAHRESFGIKELTTMAKLYPFQSTAVVNYLFNDISSIAYISRNKPFSSFLQTLAEDLSLFPNLVIIHMPGRCLWYADILSRQHDHVAVQRTDTNISKEQALLVPALRDIKPGAVLSNTELLDLFSVTFGLEVTDVSDSDYVYIQKIIWDLYTNPHQFFSSEHEFLIGSLIARFDPELALALPTIQDIFRVKETGNKLKTKAQKIQFLKQLSENLKDLPYDSRQLQK
jgi:hypothetical protein